MQFLEIINNFFLVQLIIKSKGTEAVMFFNYLTALFSSLGGNIIKLFIFDYLQVLSDVNKNIRY